MTIDAELEKALSGKLIPEHVLVRLDAGFPADASPSRASASFSYVGLRDGLPMVRELCTLLKKSLLDFCLPRSEILAAKAEYEKTDDPAVFLELLDKSRSLFIKAREETKRSGEGGELILFSLMEAEGAPQLISKMYLKTATDMPIHGSDGLHIGFDPDSKYLTIYIGEAKLHSDYDGALADALSSVLELHSDSEKMKREFELITDNLDSASLSDEFLQVFQDYLNPYSPISVKRRDAHACLIGFDFVDYSSITSSDPTTSQDELERTLRKFAEQKLKNLSARLEKDKYKDINFLFFFLPFPSVERFRQVFNEEVLRV